MFSTVGFKNTYIYERDEKSGMNVYISIIITIVFTVLGQVLTKKGMSMAGAMPTKSPELVMYLVKNMLLNPYVFLVMDLNNNL
jgi:hypothetical protein